MNISTIERRGTLDGREVLGREYTIPDNSQLLGESIPEGTKRLYEFVFLDDQGGQVLCFDRPDFQEVHLDVREKLRHAFTDNSFCLESGSLYGDGIVNPKWERRKLELELGIYHTPEYWENLSVKSMDFLVRNNDLAVKFKRGLFGMHAKVEVDPPRKLYMWTQGQDLVSDQYSIGALNVGVIADSLNALNSGELPFDKEIERAKQAGEKMLVGISTLPNPTSNYMLDCFSLEGRMYMMDDNVIS